MKSQVRRGVGSGICCRERLCVSPKDHFKSDQTSRQNLEHMLSHDNDDDDDDHVDDFASLPRPYHHFLSIIIVYFLVELM